MSSVICVLKGKRRLFANVLGMCQTWVHGQACEEHPLPPLERRCGSERLAIQTGRMGRLFPPEGGRTIGRKWEGPDTEREKDDGKSNGTCSRRTFRKSA